MDGTARGAKTKKRITAEACPELAEGAQRTQRNEDCSEVCIEITSRPAVGKTPAMK